LDLAEKEGRIVILAGHIAPGCYTCVNNWSERYTILYERYQHIIRLAVFGHDHRELYEIVRSTTSDKPIGMHYVSGSLGTYLQVNPSVRIFKMHAKHHIPIETKVLEFNIELANQGIFEFKEVESKPKTYDPIMKNLSPVSYGLLSESFLTNDTAA
jgi:sphingomyelin phosphodiesterase